MKGPSAPAARRAAALLALVLVAVAPACKNKDDGPAIDEPSTGPKAVVVQFRPVAAKEPADCKPMSFTPPLTETLDVLYQGQCLHLEVPAMVLSKATVTSAVTPPDDSLAATLLLGGKDKASMAEMSTKYQGRRIAMVAFGKVLVAPVMQAPVVDGKVEIRGMTRADIARLQAALK
jgi:preprotein translocase subunit SecD